LWVGSEFLILLLLLLQMIKDAIVCLKEKTGSSQYAIAKFIEEKQKQLPPNFRKLLLFHLKKLVAGGKLVKVKGSFKLPAPKLSLRSRRLRR
jgi:histone H1/5